MKRTFRFGLTVALSVILVVLGFRGADLGAVWRSLLEADLFYLILAVALGLVAFVGRSYRWGALVNHLGKKVSLYSLFSSTLIGFMMSYILPLRVGELVRPILLASREGISKGAVVATVAVARMMDFLTVLVLFSVYLIGFANRLPEDGSDWMNQFRARGLFLGLAILAAVGVLYAVVLSRGRLFSWLESRTRSKGPARKVIDVLHSVVRGFEVLRGGRVLARALALTFLTWILIDLSILAGLAAFNVSMDFFDVFLLVTFLAVGIAVPTPAGLGSYQAAGLFCLERFFRVGHEVALAAIWAQWGIAVLPVVALGMILMWREGMTLSEVGSMAKQDGGPTP